MAAGDYTYSELSQEIVDPKRDDNITDTVTLLNVVNRAARAVIRSIDLRGTKRNAQLASKLFPEVYNYAAPSDYKAVIDVQPQANRSIRTQIELVDEARFDRTKRANYGRRFALKTDDFTERVLFDGDDINSEVLSISGLNSLTSDATWTVFGNADNLTLNTTNSIQGGGSLSIDLTSGGTTAGIYATDLSTKDISKFTTDGSLFIWVYIVATANITNFICDIGNDLTTNYYTQTITTNAWGASFEAGWNLLRFDFASMTENGTVTDTAIDSFRIYMTKSSGKTGSGYLFDDVRVRTGEYHNILYYSQCPWQNSSGTYINDATTDTDVINADFDEIDLFILRGKAELHRELKEYDEMKLTLEEFELAKREYMRRNPSERLTVNRRYY